jgi:hypothetical protein
MTYINCVTHDTPWGEVEVREMPGLDEFHVFFRGERYDVFVEEGQDGWFTELAHVIYGPRATAAEVIDEFFLNPLVPAHLRGDTTAVVQHDDGTETLTSYESVELRGDGDTAIEVRKVTGLNRFHIAAGVDLFDVWCGEDDFWYTQLAGEQDGPYETADTLIEDLFLNPEML